MNSFEQNIKSRDSSQQSKLNMKFSSQVRQKQRHRIFNSQRKKHAQDMEEEIYYKKYDELFMQEIKAQLAEQQARREYEEYEQSFYEEMYRQSMFGSEMKDQKYEEDEEDDNSSMKVQCEPDRKFSQDPSQAV